MERSKDIAKLGLNAALAAIGVQVSVKRLREFQIDAVDLESVIAEVCVTFGKGEALSLWGPVFTWIDIHGGSVIVEKLMKILDQKRANGDDVSFASLLGAWGKERGHKRWARLLRYRPEEEKWAGPEDLAASFMALRGPEDWSFESGYNLPNGIVEVQPKWVLSRSSLASLNRQYLNRLLYGAGWRADIVTAIERGAKTPTEVQKACGASYEPCYRIFNELLAAGIVGRKVS